MKSTTIGILTFRLRASSLDPFDLVIVAVHQRDPGEVALGIAPVGLVEHAGDDRRWRRW